MTDKEESTNEKIGFDLDSNNPEEKEIIDWLKQKYPKPETPQEEVKFNQTDNIKEFITETLKDEKAREYSLKFVGIAIILIGVILLLVFIRPEKLYDTFGIFGISFLITILLAIAIFLLLKVDRFRTRFNRWQIKNVKGIDLMTLQGTTIIGVLFFLSLSLTDNFRIGEISLSNETYDKETVKQAITSLTASIVFIFIFAACLTGLLGDSQHPTYPLSTTPWAYKIGLIFTVLGFGFLAFTMLVVALSNIGNNNVDTNNLEKIVKLIQDGNYTISIQATHGKV